MNLKKFGVVIALIFSLFGTACAQTTPVSDVTEVKSDKTSESLNTSKPSTKKSATKKPSVKNSSTKTPTTKTPTTKTPATKTPATKAPVTKEPSLDEDFKPVSLSDIPQYSNEAYVEVNDNKPGFSSSDKKITKAFEFYSDLDHLGRCGQAYANICKEIQPTTKRGPIGQVRPSGWHTVKYNDLIDGNYLYNRCHLIGYQLAGENANEKNLITGTRYLNVIGMLEFEDKVDDYVDATGNHVLYRVTPIYDGDNLVASGVQIEGWSVEDKGSGICFNVFCYNVQPGIHIDYSNGDSYAINTHNSKNDSQASNSDDSKNNSQASNSHNSNSGSQTDRNEMTYILNTNTKKFHLSGCSSVNQMAENNKKKYSGTRDEVIDMGYTPCGRCNP